MVDICFNELSVFPLCANEAEMQKRVATFVTLMKRLGNYGFKKLRCEKGLEDFRLTKEKTLSDYCQIALSRPNMKSKEMDNALFLLSWIRKPYLEEDEEDLFNKADDVKLCIDEVNDVWCDCYGFYVAYLLNTFVVSFDMPVNNPYNLMVYKSKGDRLLENKVSIINVSNEVQLDNDEIVIQCLSGMDLSIKKASKKAMSFTLPAHHGLHECMQHGKALINDPYVCDILSSTSFDSGENRYIHAVRSDGVIDVRLHWTKTGFGLRILTSATDIIEAWWIAKHLQKAYGKVK